MLRKVALISDIQGNLTALNAVLAQIANIAVDQIICLGDVASGAQPHQVLSLLRDKQIHVVKGNMDDKILNPHGHDSDDLDQQRFHDMDVWCSAQLTDSDKSYIRSFRRSILFELVDSYQLLCFHGSPYSYDDVIDETLSELELAKRLYGYEQDVLATGHMHHQFLRPFHTSMIVNPGSVGLPRKRPDGTSTGKHPLHAQYALLEIVEGQINLAFRSVPVPTQAFIQGILDSGMPHAEWFLSQWDVDY